MSTSLVTRTDGHRWYRLYRWYKLRAFRRQPIWEAVDSADPPDPGREAAPPLQEATAEVPRC